MICSVCGCTMRVPMGAHLPYICKVRCCGRQHSLSSTEVSLRQLSNFIVPSLVDLEQTWGSSVKAVSSAYMVAFSSNVISSSL